MPGMLKNFHVRILTCASVTSIRRQICIKGLWFLSSSALPRVLLMRKMATGGVQVGPRVIPSTLSNTVPEIRSRSTALISRPITFIPACSWKSLASALPTVPLLLSSLTRIRLRWVPMNTGTSCWIATLVRIASALYGSACDVLASCGYNLKMDGHHRSRRSEPVGCLGPRHAPQDFSSRCWANSRKR